MKHLKEEIEKIIDNTGSHYIALGVNYAADKPDSIRIKQLLTLFSEVIDEIIGEDKENMDYVTNKGGHTHDYETDAMNDLRKQQRARKKELGL